MTFSLTSEGLAAREAWGKNPVQNSLDQFSQLDRAFKLLRTPKPAE
jgi:hypothetical protein